MDWNKWDWNDKRTSWEWDIRKKHITCYKRCVFQESGEEQANTKHTNCY